MAEQLLQAAQPPQLQGRGQGAAWQGRVSASWVQARAPPRATRRLRVCVPTPHVAEHGLHLPYSPYWKSAHVII